MRKLIIDTNIFSAAFRNMDFDVFPDIWEPWEDLIKNNIIVSVDEVFNELSQQFTDKSEYFTWMKRHKKIFQNMTNDECLIVADIFSNIKFQEGIKERSLRSGSPEADAFIVAKAKALSGIVVTDEKGKPNSEKIPNICDKYGVPYMDKNNFFRLLKNIAGSKDYHHNVDIFSSFNQKSSLYTHLSY